MAPSRTADSPSNPDSLHKLDNSQVQRAAKALLKHVKSEATKGNTEGAKNLFAPDEKDADAPEDSVQILCQITTKKHIVEEKRLKPGKIPMPHSLNLPETTSICLITPDPQRQFKDVLDHPSFPAALAKQIRILGLTKLKQRYKTFESRRQLKAEYDVFLADDRVITMLPRLLGKTLYQSSKRPIPIKLMPPRPKAIEGVAKSKVANEPKLVLAPEAFAAEIQSVLTCARVHLSPSVSTAIQVGWSVFSPEQVAANVAAVVQGMVDSFIPKGWKNIRAIHIKSPTSIALPIWETDELWMDEEDVIEDHEAEEIARQRERALHGKRKGRALEQEMDEVTKKIKSGDASKTADDGFSKEMAERREALRQQRQAGRAAAEEQEAKAVKKSALKKAKAGSSKVPDEARAIKASS